MVTMWKKMKAYRFNGAQTGSFRMSRLLMSFVLVLWGFVLLAWGTDWSDVAEVAREGERVRNLAARMTPGADWVDQVVAPGEVGLEECEPFSLELDPDTLETLVIDDRDEVCGSVYTGIGRAESSRVVLWVEPDAELFPEPPAGRQLATRTRSGTETNFCISIFEKLPDGNLRVTVTNGGTTAEAEIFAFTMTADLNSVTNVWTNDENVVTTLVSTVYSNWSPSLAGFSSAWTRVAAHVPLTDGVGTWTDTSVLPTTPVRFYAAALRQDSDGDGLTDGEELFVYHTDPASDVSQTGGWADVDMATFGMTPADSAVYHYVSNGVAITWTNNLKADWIWGRSIGSNASLTISLMLTHGVAVWATFCDRAGVAESFEVSVTNAHVAYRSDGLFSTDELPVTRLLLVPTNDLPMQVNIHDTSHANVGPDHWGADIRGAFLPVEIDLEVGGTPEILEDEPGAFVMDRQVYTNAHLTPYILSATWIPSLPGEIGLEGMEDVIRLVDSVGQEEAESHITWDDPVKVGMLGGYGATSVVLRAVWNMDTNLWDEAKVTSTQIRLEPVTIEGGLPSWNPCGIVLGSNALFHVDVFPTNVPESAVIWQIAHGGVEFDENISTGRTVSVSGTGLSGFGLTVNVGNAFAPVPHIEGRVVEEAEIKVYPFILANGGTQAVDASFVQNQFDRANLIYRQAGIHFALQPIAVMETNAWTYLQLYASGDWPEFWTLVNTHHGLDGVEAYFVRSIEDANGLTAHGGIAIPSHAPSVTLAHELGHSMGVPDIYTTRTNISSVTGFVQAAWAPHDWSGDTNESYYAPELMQSNLLRRLVMYGVGIDSKADVPMGDIHGIAKEAGQYQHRLVPLGMTNLNRTAISQ